jgi:hypothetical protein
LRVINAANVNNPVEVGDWDTPGYAYDVAVAGDVAYVADGEDGGLRIINVSIASTPAELGYISDLGNVREVQIVAGLAYLAAETAMQVVDVTSPTDPAIVETFSPTTTADTLALSGNDIFLGDQENGLLVLAPSQLIFLPLVIRQ